MVDHSTFQSGYDVDTLFFGLLPANVELPELGTALVDPLFPTVVTATPGQSLSLPIPGDAALLGAGLSVQVLSSAGAQHELTNAIDLVIGSR